MTDKLARDLALSALDKVNKTVEGVPKDYVDDHLSRKVDKIESSSANPRLYGVSEAGSQTSYFATQTANAHTTRYERREWQVPSRKRVGSETSRE